jgi:ABC-type Fe3+/spermidine/putrescine transport system ATPase subunit
VRLDARHRQAAGALMAGPILRLAGITKNFQGQRVLHALDLDIAEGEFLTLLGPSGCGKTTTLNIVAGFLRPDEGELYLRGQPARDLPPQRRRLGMVFQSWALFPHMTVFENIAYGLRMQKVAKPELARRVEAMLELVRLPAAAAKYPSQLSGGMQQRVALARALVTEPDLLLLDEPLSNLDAALRREMQVEIKQIHERLRVTTLLVTHSQEEALVMSDRIAVMRAGRIERIDTPASIYGDPRTAFVCTFLGDANVLDGVIERTDDGGTHLRVGEARILAAQRSPRSAGQAQKLAIRPEHIDILPEPRPGSIPGRVVDTIFKGSNVTLRVACDGLELMVLSLPQAGAPMAVRGAQVSLAVPPHSVILLDDEAAHG